MVDCSAAAVSRRQQQLYNTDVGGKPLQQQQQQQFDRLSTSLTTAKAREVNMPREGVCEVLDKTADQVAESSTALYIFTFIRSQTKEKNAITRQTKGR